MMSLPDQIEGRAEVVRKGEGRGERGEGRRSMAKKIRLSPFQLFGTSMSSKNDLYSSLSSASSKKVSVSKYSEKI
jgi:hypothetical protein